MADGWEPREDTTRETPRETALRPSVGVWQRGCARSASAGLPSLQARNVAQPRCKHSRSSLPQARPVLPDAAQGVLQPIREAQAQAIALCRRKAVFLLSRWRGRGRTEPRYLKVTNCVCREEDFIPCGASHGFCSKLSFAGNSMFSTKCWKLRRRLRGIILRAFAFVVPWFLLSGRAYQ